MQRRAEFTRFLAAHYMRCLAVVLAFLACAPIARPESSQTPAGQHPEWAGFYRFARGSDLAGFEHVNLNLDDVVKAHLQKWALEKIDVTNGVADDTGAICQIAGIFRHQQVGSFYWLPVAGKIVMANNAPQGTRRIYTGRKHPQFPRPTWLGDSVGTWEGDMLVVDTVGFNDKSWLMSGLEPHTEETHVVERIRMVTPVLMEIQTTVADRKALKSDYSFTRYYKKAGESDPEEPSANVCNGDVGEQREWAQYRREALKHPPAFTTAK